MLEIVSFGTLGIACSGIIKRIGSNVEDFHVGDRIFTLSPNEFRNRFSIPAAACNKIPADINPIVILMPHTVDMVVLANFINSGLHGISCSVHDSCQRYFAYCQDGKGGSKYSNH